MRWNTKLRLRLRSLLRRARVEEELAASSKAAINSACICGVMALRRSGRLSVIVRMPSASSIRMVSGK